MPVCGTANWCSLFCIVMLSNDVVFYYNKTSLTNSLNPEKIGLLLISGTLDNV